MNGEFRIFGLLPNASLTEAIEEGPMALVPHNDARIEDIIARDANIGKFLHAFRDTFGRPVAPSVFLVSEGAPETFKTSDARSSFRDAIALSLIPYGWTQMNRGEPGPSTVWADYFSVYAWVPAQDSTLLVGMTPALRGVDELNRFRGQTSSDLVPQRVDPIHIDTPVLSELLRRWRRLFASRRPSWSDRALFRSLNMAFRASKMPAGKDTTFYDIGALTALWVSAFEILAHPGTGGRVNLQKVYDMLEQTPWLQSESGEKRSMTFNGMRHKRSRRCCACWLYGELYSARCDFLHGNPVRNSKLLIKRSGRPLVQYAAPLYRIALTSFLNLRFREREPASNDTDAQKHFARRRARHQFFQSWTELTLLQSRTRRATA